MYKPKTIYHSFGNRLGVLRKALASDVPDRYLKSYYGGIHISGGDEIYQEDVKLISFYFRECRINGGDRFDADKFYKEAERRIKGIEETETAPLVKLLDKAIVCANEFRESTPINMLDRHDSTDQIFSREQELEFEKMMVLLMVNGIHGDFFNYQDDKLEGFFYYKLEEQLRGSFDREVVHKFVLWIKSKYGVFIKSYLDATYNDDIPF